VTIEPVLRLDGLGHRLGREEVLRAITLSLAPGTIAGLAGLNGEGKTTLMRLCAGLDRPLRGTVRVLGRDPREATARKALAYLPESHRAPPTARGLDWIAAQLAAWGRRADRATITTFGATLDLEERDLLRPLGLCSKGTERKVALAATLLADAPLTLLDEPADGLDPRARAALKARLRDRRERGGVVLLSSHVLAEVGDLCDRLLVLADGHLVHDGPPDALVAEAGTDDLESAVLARVAGLS
jgi:ABC-2 type transport system ATP-binding protein